MLHVSTEAAGSALDYFESRARQALAGEVVLGRHPRRQAPRRAPERKRNFTGVYPESLIAWIRAARRDGMAIEEIARQAKVGPQTVYRFIQ